MRPSGMMIINPSILLYNKTTYTAGSRRWQRVRPREAPLRSPPVRARRKRPSGGSPEVKQNSMAMYATGPLGSGSFFVAVSVRGCTPYAQHVYTAVLSMLYVQVYRWKLH